MQVLLMLLAPLVAQAFVPAAPFLQRTTTTPTRILAPLHETTMKAPVEKDALNNKEDRKYCIPLEDIRLDDLAKVGGCVVCVC